MPRLLAALTEADAMGLPDEFLPLPLHLRRGTHQALLQESAVPLAVRGRATWRHVRGSGPCFLNTGAVPTSLLTRTLAAGSEVFSDGAGVPEAFRPASGAPGISPSISDQVPILGALAMPLAAHVALRFDAGAKDLTMTSFVNEGKVFGDCHDHYDADVASRFHDYKIDVKPLSVGRIARMAFAGVTNIMEHMGMGPAEMLLMLALIAIWFPYGMKLPKLSVKNVFKGIGKGFKSVGKGFKSLGKGIGKGFKMGLKLTVSIGRGIGKLAVSIGAGLLAGAVFLGKGLVKIVKITAKALASAAVLAAKAIAAGAKLLWKGTKMLAGALWAGAKLAWTATKFMAKKAWKATKFVAKGAWKLTKFAAKGLWKAAKFAAKGLVTMVKWLDRAVKATGRGILAVGKAVGNAPWAKAALIGGGILLLGGALLLAHGATRGRGRGRMRFGGKGGKNGGGRRKGGNAREQAMQLAAERKAAREAAKAQKRRRDGAVEQEGFGLPNKHKKAKDASIEDMSVDHQYNSHGHGGKAALAAGALAGGAMLAHQTEGHHGEDHHPGAEEIPVVIGRRPTMGNDEPGAVIYGIKPKEGDNMEAKENGGDKHEGDATEHGGDEHGGEATEHGGDEHEGEKQGATHGNKNAGDKHGGKHGDKHADKHRGSKSHAAEHHEDARVDQLAAAQYYAEEMTGKRGKYEVSKSESLHKKTIEDDKKAIEAFKAYEGQAKRPLRRPSASELSSNRPARRARSEPVRSPSQQTWSREEQQVFKKDVARQARQRRHSEARLEDYYKIGESNKYPLSVKASPESILAAPNYDNSGNLRGKVSLRVQNDYTETKLQAMQHQPHRVTSSVLQIDAAPDRVPRVVRRASAFFDAVDSQSQEDFSTASSLSELGRPGKDIAMGDDPLYPLYYLDRDGKKQEFREPVTLKPAQLKFAMGAKIAGLLFLEVSIPQKQLMCTTGAVLESESESSQWSDCSCAD